ncbi:hypothetical protein Tco_1313634 [Tanacetum coccineum]
MKAVKDKDVLQKIVDSWFASSKNLWKLVDCGMSSTVKIGLGYGIKSNAEVLGYEEEISRGIFAFRETNAGYNDIPLYSRFKQVEYKGVPHPLSGDYTPREQEDIDDSLYEYGKYGPQPQSPSPIESDASSTVSSTCQSNDSDGEQGIVSDHSVNDDSIPIPSSEQVSISTQKTQPQVPKPQQTVDPSCAQHVKTPRQPIDISVLLSPISFYIDRIGIKDMERELGQMGIAVKISGKLCLEKNITTLQYQLWTTPASYVHVSQRSTWQTQACECMGGPQRGNNILFVCAGHTLKHKEHREGYFQTFQNVTLVLLVRRENATTRPSVGQIDDMLTTHYIPLHSGFIWTNFAVRSINHAKKQLITLLDIAFNSLVKSDKASKHKILMSFCLATTQSLATIRPWSKAFRVYNLVTKKVEVNLHVNFLEDKPNVQGIGHRWMFDLDYLTDSMNYIPVSLQNQANPAGSKEVIDIDVQTEEDADLMVVSSTSLSEKIATKKTLSPRQPSSTPISKSADDIMTFRKELDALALKHLGPVPTTVPTSTNPVNTGSINLNPAFEKINTGNTEVISPSADHEEEIFSDADDDEMPEIRIYDKSSEGIFEKASYDDDGIISDFNNLPDEVDVPTNPTLRIHNAHPQSQILGDPNTPVQTRSSLKKITEAHALVSYIQAHQGSNHKVQQHCLIDCVHSLSNGC